MRYPFVSIIIVNFNGCDLLKRNLKALGNLDYPKGAFEIIVVDNNSVDNSVQFISTHYPHVRVVKSESNQGFTGGNILGANKARGEYLVLLNTDVIVDTHWLKELVKAAKDPKVGLISSKLRFAIPFIELKINSKIVPRSQLSASIDHSPVGVLIENIECKTPYLSSLVYYREGFYNKTDGEVVVRRTKGSASVLLPFPQGESSQVYKLKIHGYEQSGKNQIPVELTTGSKKIKLEVLPYEAKQVNISISKNEVSRHLIWLIQNAGNVVMKTGYSKDRGSLVDIADNEVKEFYETESHYFSKPVELLAACGAACLIKRKVIDKIGFLDGHYFMYYEDIEFSLRAWRAGWKIVYAPLAIGYHAHRATTGTGETPFFLEHVERNRLATLMLHFPWSVILSEWILYLIRFGLTAFKYTVFRFRDNLERTRIWNQRYEGRKGAMLFIVRSFPRLLVSRSKMNQYWPIKRKIMSQMTY